MSLDDQLKQEEDNQAKIAKAFLKEHKTKYMAGAVEHADNGLLQEVPAKVLVEFAIEEVLDLASYLYTLREKLEYSEEN